MMSSCAIKLLFSRGYTAQTWLSVFTTQPYRSAVKALAHLLNAKANAIHRGYWFMTLQSYCRAGSIALDESTELDCHQSVLTGAMSVFLGK